MDALEPLLAHPGVSEVRGGTGLMAAVELDEEVFSDRVQAAAEVARLARAEGVLARPFAAGLALSPPLVVDVEQLQMIADAISAALDNCATGVAASQQSR